MASLKDGTLRLRYDKRQSDFVIDFPRKVDGRLLYGVACMPREYLDVLDDTVKHHPSLIEELEQRGYDTTTLVITVRRKTATDT